MSFNKTATFSLYSSLSVTTMDLPLSAGRTFTDSSFRKLSSAVFCAFGILIDAGTLQFLRMFAIETRPRVNQHTESTEEEVMVSFDVKSLFTSIPVILALTITKDRLQRDQKLAERSYLSVDNILKLSDFVLNHNYFKYDGDHYKQIFGCGMGSPISPVLAHLVMEEIEETAISTFPHPPKWCFRYVDDSHSCLRKDQVD